MQPVFACLAILTHKSDKARFEGLFVRITVWLKKGDKPRKKSALTAAGKNVIVFQIDKNYGKLLKTCFGKFFVRPFWITNNKERT